MKSNTLLAAFAGLAFVTATPILTDLAADPVRPLLKRGALLFWDPHDAYAKYGQHQSKRKYWEKKCANVLDVLNSENCAAGFIHKGESQSTTPDGKQKWYVRVEVLPLMDGGHAKKLRVYEDGTYEDFSKHGWTAWDRKAMATAKRSHGMPVWKTAKEQSSSDQAPSPDHYQVGSKRPLEAITGTQAPAHDAKLNISWDPSNVYMSQQKKRKFWETQCAQALAKEGCIAGVIHQGQAKIKQPDGTKKSYVRVEGTPSSSSSSSSSDMDTEQPKKKLRVYDDGSSEDFSKIGWTKQDREAMAIAKRPKGPRRWTVNHPGSPEEVSIPRAPADDAELEPGPIVTWYPPEAYTHRPLLRQSFQQACHKALVTEGCAFGMIHKGHHNDKKPDGTFSPWVTVSAGTDKDNTKYMRLFEDGTSEWYPPGVQLPRKSKPRYRPKRQKIEEASTSQAHGQAASPGQFQAPSGGEHQVAFPGQF